MSGEAGIAKTTEGEAKDQTLKRENTAPLLQRQNSKYSMEQRAKRKASVAADEPTKAPPPASGKSSTCTIL
jgi:hypothetical protein